MENDVSSSSDVEQSVEVAAEPTAEDQQAKMDAVYLLCAVVTAAAVFSLLKKLNIKLPSVFQKLTSPALPIVEEPKVVTFEVPSDPPVEKAEAPAPQPEEPKQEEPKPEEPKSEPAPEPKEPEPAPEKPAKKAKKKASKKKKSK